MEVNMNRKMDTAYGINRLESKNARAAIIQKISADFNLMPLVAEAYYKQISSYFEQHADVQLTSGQICTAQNLPKNNGRSLDLSTG